MPAQRGCNSFNAVTFQVLIAAATVEHGFFAYGVLQNPEAVQLSSELLCCWACTAVMLLTWQVS